MYRHLVGRGVEIAYEQAGKVERFDVEVPKWAPFLLAATVAFYCFLHLAVTYAFGILVPILTMVEAPSTTTVVRSTETYHDDENPDAPLLSKEEKESQKTHIDEEIMVVSHKPITSKLKTTMRHLRAQTGSKRSHWRGFGGFVIYNIAKVWGIGIVRALIPLRICGRMAEIPVAGVLCLLSAAWIQQMVAMPEKTYFQRVSELSRASAFKQLFLSVIAVEVVEMAAFMLPQQLTILFATASDATKDNNSSIAVMGIGAFVIAFTLIASIVFVVIPLNIGLVRLQASLLSQESETVIPIDRTLAEAEKKNIKTAWKSFTRQGCRLLAKNYLKYMLIQMFVGVTFGLTIVTQLYLIFGKKALEAARKHYEQQM